MGAPYSQLQQISGHSPIREIGTDVLKSFYFGIEVPVMGLDLDVKVAKINYDQPAFVARLKSGSFTPALREAELLKSTPSGNQRGELFDRPRFSAKVTGQLIEPPRGVPLLDTKLSGFDYGIAREVGYIQFSEFRGVFDDFWHDHPPFVYTFSGNIYGYKEDAENADFIFLTGRYEKEHVAEKQDAQLVSESPGVFQFFFQTGTYVGGQD